MYNIIVNKTDREQAKGENEVAKAYWRHQHNIGQGYRYISQEADRKYVV